MELVFNKGYICSGCNGHFRKRDASFIHKRSCICKTCYSRFMPYSKDMYHEERDGMSFMTALFRYREPYRKIFLEFKFNGQIAAGHLIGMAMEELIKERDAFYDYQYLVPVPVSKERMNERGYNQSEILAQYIAKGLGIPMRDIMIRVRNSLPQSRIMNHKRAENVKNAFDVTEKLNGENIILFDDVYTTGSTAMECVNVLHNAGAGKVCVVAGAYNAPVYVDRTIYLN